MYIYPNSRLSAGVLKFQAHPVFLMPMAKEELLALIVRANERQQQLVIKLLAVFARIRRAALARLARVVKAFASDTEWCAEPFIQTLPIGNIIQAQEVQPVLIKAPVAIQPMSVQGQAPLALVQDAAAYERTMTLYHARIDAKGKPEEDIMQRIWNSHSAASVLASKIR